MAAFKDLLTLLQIFIPSWRFFDKPGDQAELFYQIAEGPWQAAIRETSSGWRQFLLNSEGNLEHAGQNLANRLLLELRNCDGETVEDITSFKLVVNLIRYQIRKYEPASAGRNFRFKLSLAQSTQTDLLISAAYEV